VKSNLRNVDHAATSVILSTVRFRQNTFEGHTIGPVTSAIRTDRANRVVFGPDAATTGDNLIKTTGSVSLGKFIFENDTNNANTLNAVGNQWYVGGALTADSTTIRQRITKGTGVSGLVLVDHSSPKQTPSSPACSVPSGAWAGPAVAVDPEIESDVVDATLPAGIPDRTALQVAGPSPFRAGTDLQVDIAEAVRAATLRIYDVRGRLVRELVDQDVAPGRYRVHWDGP
jgi:hypothetical protein